MLTHRLLDRLAADGEDISRRLRARISFWELFALILALALLAVSAHFQTVLGILPVDMRFFLNTSRGDFSDFYYAYWILPLFSLLALLPPMLAYAIWATVNILGVFFAARVFGGRVPLALLSFQMLYVIFVGQIVGLICAGLALLWWALKSKRWELAGLGLSIACTKFHIGVILGAAILMVADISWRKRLRVLIIPAIVLALSLVIYPMWPLDLVETIRSSPANQWGSIALWRWIGPFALVLWIPPLFLPLSRPQRLAALTATTALAVPYFQQTDLLTLFVLPIGWAYVLAGNVGYLFFAVFWDWIWVLSIAVFLAYSSIIFPALWRFAASRARFSRPQE